MDTRTFLHAIAPVSARQFAVFRIVLGLYLTVHFVQLIPWGVELFSSAGMLSDPALNPTYGLFLNILSWWDSPAMVTAFLVALTVFAILFTAGIARRTMAVLLWYGWACLFHRNVLISNPSIPYIGLILLLSSFVPATEAWRVRLFQSKRTVRSAGDMEFYMPMAVFVTAWVLMAAGYTFSGIVKLYSPSWVDGSAFLHVLNNPLARTGWFRDAVLALPTLVLQGSTWLTLAIEIFCAPLMLWRTTRPYIWLITVFMHITLMGLVSFAELSIGMLLLHLFTFDSRWKIWGERCSIDLAPVLLER